MEPSLSSLIASAEGGDRSAVDALFAALYSELHRLARRKLARGANDITLGTTTLLHEAYLEMAGRESAVFPDRGRFMAYAARVMRGLIIDYARSRQAHKRGGQFKIEALGSEVADPVADHKELTRISEALDELATVDPLLAQVVDLKFFCGFSFAEIAAMRGLSERTVQRHWEKAPALALGLTNSRRSQEAQLIVGRRRQIPGREQDPLIDYADARIALELREPQRALVLFTRARDGAPARGRGELVGQVRAARGTVLVRLGDLDEARIEMELARADFERAGDHASLSGLLNNLAIQDLHRGDMVRGEALLESALTEARAAGQQPLLILHNLALLAMQRGRPDLAEPKLREELESYRRSRARIDAEAGRLAEARRRLEAPGEENARSASVSRRLVFLASRAALAGAEHRFDDARRDLESARGATDQADRKVDSLSLRVDLAELERRAGDPVRAAAAARTIAAEAGALELAAVVARTRSLEAMRHAGG